jgi:hypothetical protein
MVPWPATRLILGSPSNSSPDSTRQRAKKRDLINGSADVYRGQEKLSLGPGRSPISMSPSVASDWMVFVKPNLVGPEEFWRCDSE